MSYVSLFLHFVWTTKHRQAWLLPDVEERLRAVMIAEAKALGCQVLAINSVPDHVHLLVHAPTKIRPMELMRQVKGVSSRFATDTLGLTGFAWQEGYGVFSVSRNHVAQVCRYIWNQKEHHRVGRTWPALEVSERKEPEEPEEPGGESPGSE